VDFVSIHRWASTERSRHFRQHREPEGAPNAGGSIESFRAKKTLNRKPHLVEDRFKSPKPECGDCKKLRPLSRSGLDRPRPDNGEDHPSALRNSSRFGPAWCGAAHPQKPIIRPLPSLARRATRSATSSLLRCATSVIAGFIGTGARPRAGKNARTDPLPIAAGSGITHRPTTR
jgi:hypothetical protein